MPVPDFVRLYSRQEYMTPGAAETVECVFDVARPNGSSTLLDVACGKGEAACALAERSGCRVVGVDLWPIFFPQVRAKVDARRLWQNVRLVRADGKRLPVRRGGFDGAYCIGGPAIVGLTDCLQELARVVRPGGVVVVSDIVWRVQPGALGPEWKWVASMQQTTMEEYAKAITYTGLNVEERIVFPPSVWNAYHAPMLEVTNEARANGDVAFADENEGNVAMEKRAVERFFDYTMFVARKPS